MRYRNYRNRYNRSNRIYSREDLLKMSLDNIFDNEDTILAQNSDIGIPSHEELQLSPSTNWVAPFVNEKGNLDGGYWQSTLLPKPEEEDNMDWYFDGTEIQSSQNIQQNQAPEEDMYNDNSEELLNDENENDDDEIYDEYALPYPLEGLVENSLLFTDKVLSKLRDMNIISEEFKNKYEGLRLMEQVQKAASKIPIDTVEREYYGLSTKLKDKELLDGKEMEENDIYSLKDIKDLEQKKYYQDYLAKMYGLDPNDPATYEQLQDKQIVVPKETSRLYQYAKNSDAMRKWISENYERIKNGEKPIRNWVEFPLGGIKGAIKNKQRGLFATLHNMDIKDAKLNSDGSLDLWGMDPYDYAHSDYFQNVDNFKSLLRETAKSPFILLNNIANGQQEAKQLENFLFSLLLKYSKEELEEIKRLFYFQKNAKKRQTVKQIKAIIEDVQ